MKLRGIDFGSVFDAAGVEGFFGEGYKHQKFLGPFRPNFNGCTFVAKTTTLEPREGNMPMGKNRLTPKELMPKCILPNFQPGNIFLSLKMFLGGYMLNAVGLSGPGAKALFEDGRWQKRTSPFFVSFMSVASTPKERSLETEEFVRLFAQYLPGFKTKVGLQINYSCPNIGLDPSFLVDEAKTGLEIAHRLHIPLMPKFNILVPVDAAREISRSIYCDAICVSNTIHWNDLPKLGIDRKKLFGSDISPLAKFGGGGLSGKPLLPLIVNWLTRAEAADFLKPINAGGGILSPNDIAPLYGADALSIFIGSVASLRPWRVRKIIKKTNLLFRNGG